MKRHADVQQHCTLRIVQQNGSVPFPPFLMKRKDRYPADWGREYWGSAGPGGMDAQSRAWQWLLVVYLRRPRNPFRLYNSQLTPSFKDIYGF